MGLAEALALDNLQHIPILCSVNASARPINQQHHQLMQRRVVCAVLHVSGGPKTAQHTLVLLRWTFASPCACGNTSQTVTLHTLTQVTV